MIASCEERDITTYLKLHLTQLKHQIPRLFPDLRKRHLPALRRPNRCLMIPHKALQHPARLIERAIPVILANSVLLQEVVLQHPRHLQRDLVWLPKSGLSDELHDLGEVLLLLEDLFGLGAEVDEAGLVLVVVGLEDLGVFGVGDGPVDGGEMFALGELFIEAPEDLNDVERGGGDGVGEISSGWGHTAFGEYDQQRKGRKVKGKATHAPTIDTVPVRSGLPKHTTFPALS